MTLRLALIFAATAGAPDGALAQAQAAPKEVAAVPPEVKARVESCDAHKFETTVKIMTAEGKVRSSKVRLCGKEGQTEAGWVATLKDAVKKLEVNTTMAPAARAQVIAALKAEILNIGAGRAGASAPPVATASTLPSEMPAAIVQPSARPPEYSTLPPLPTAPRLAAKSSPVKAGPPPKKPRLTIKCITPGEPGGGGPCLSLARTTMLTVRADEDLGGGTRLRFLRRGDERGEIYLAQMRKGQSLRSRLPKDLCSGVVRSDVQIQILARGTGQVVDTRGPYDLRC